LTFEKAFCFPFGKRLRLRDRPHHFWLLTRNDAGNNDLPACKLKAAQCH
jgi:hypothetical protein